MNRMLPVLKSWVLWYAIVLLCMPLLLLAQSPATNPADRAPEPALPPSPLEGAVIRLPDGRVIDMAELQAAHGGMVVLRQMGMGATDEKNITITEGDCVTTIQETDDEIVVTIKEGDADPVEYRAANAEELEQNHPDAFEAYQRFAQLEGQLPAQGMGVVGQRFRVRVGAPAMPGIAPVGQMLRVESLGINCTLALDPFVRSQLGEGLIVTRIEQDSLAEQVGLARWDMIKSVNGQAVRTIAELEEAVESADRLAIELIRGGKSMKLEEK